MPVFNGFPESEFALGASYRFYQRHAKHRLRLDFLARGSGMPITAKAAHLRRRGIQVREPEE
jgi:hypothetical protein